MKPILKLSKIAFKLFFGLIIIYYYNDFIQINYDQNNHSANKSTVLTFIAPTSSFNRTEQTIINELASNCAKLVYKNNISAEQALNLITKIEEKSLSIIDEALIRNNISISIKNYSWYLAKNLDLGIGINKQTQELIVISINEISPVYTFKTTNIKDAILFLTEKIQKTNSNTSQESQIKHQETIASSRAITLLIETAQKLSNQYYASNNNLHADKTAIATLLLSKNIKTFLKDEIIAAILLQGIPNEDIEKALLFENYHQLKQYLELFKITPTTYNETNIRKIDTAHQEISYPHIINKLNRLKNTSKKATFGNSNLKFYSITYKENTFYCVDILEKNLYFCLENLDLNVIFSSEKTLLDEELTKLESNLRFNKEINKIFNDFTTFKKILLNPLDFIEQHIADLEYFTQINNYLNKLLNKNNETIAPLLEETPSSLFALSFLDKKIKKQLAILKNANKKTFNDPETMASFFTPKNKSTPWDLIHEIMAIPELLLKEHFLADLPIKTDSIKITKQINGFSFDQKTFKGNKIYEKLGSNYIERLLDYHSSTNKNSLIITDIIANNRQVELHEATHEQTLAQLGNDGYIYVLQYFSPRPLQYFDRPMQYQMYIAFNKNHQIKYVFRSTQKGRIEHLEKALFLNNISENQISSKWFDIDYHTHYKQKLTQLLKGKKPDYFIAGALGYMKGHFSERLAILNLANFLFEDLNTPANEHLKQIPVIDDIKNHLEWIILNAHDTLLDNETYWNSYLEIEHRIKWALIKNQTTVINTPTIRTFRSIITNYQTKYNLNQKGNLLSVKNHLKKILHTIRKNKPRLTKEQKEILSILEIRISDTYFLKQINWLTYPAEELASVEGFLGFKKLIFYANFIDELISLFPNITNLQEYRLFGNITLFDNRVKSDLGGELALLKAENKTGENKNIIVTHLLYGQSMTPLIEVLAQMGVKTVILTGSMGGFYPQYNVGDLVVSKYFDDSSFIQTNSKTPNDLRKKTIPGIKTGNKHIIVDSIIDENENFLKEMKEKGISSIDQEFSAGYETVQRINQTRSPKRKIEIGSVGYISDLLNGINKIDVEDSVAMRKILAETFRKRLFFILDSLNITRISNIKRLTFSIHLKEELTRLEKKLKANKLHKPLIKKIIKIFGSLRYFTNTLLDSNKFIETRKEKLNVLLNLNSTLSEFMKRGGPLGDNPHNDFPCITSRLIELLDLINQYIEIIPSDQKTKQIQLPHLNEEYVYTLYKSIAEENLINAKDEDIDNIINHAKRTVKLFEIIATKLDIPKERIQAAKTPLLLHDIGKVANPEVYNLIQREGKLSAIEMTIVRSHAKAINTILNQEGIHISTPLELAISSHHSPQALQTNPYFKNHNDARKIAEALIVSDYLDAYYDETRPYKNKDIDFVNTSKPLAAMHEYLGDYVDAIVFDSLEQLSSETNIPFFQTIADTSTDKFIKKLKRDIMTKNIRQLQPIMNEINSNNIAEGNLNLQLSANTWNLTIKNPDNPNNTIISFIIPPQQQETLNTIIKYSIKKIFKKSA